MAAAKRFTTQQIVAKLREAERLQGRGATIPAICTTLQINEQTFLPTSVKSG